MHTVFLLHGIRTRAFWYDTALPTLSGIPDTQVTPLSYGYFDLVRFIMPGRLRRRPRNFISREINAFYVSSAFTNVDRISVIAHSFGTYCIIKCLEEEQFAIHNLILCGSVVPARYDFAKITRSVSGQIVNDVGFKDAWPIVARFASWGYGASGTFGFGSSRCSDRFHDLDHSGFFSFDFMHTYWRPIIQSDSVPASSFSRASRALPLRIRLLSVFPPMLLPTVAVILLTYAVYKLARWILGSLS